MTYRTNVPPAPRLLEVRPEPKFTIVLAGTMCALFGGAGTFMLALVLVPGGVDAEAQTGALWVLGPIFVLVGLLMAFFAFRAIATKVRLVDDGGWLVIEWRRLGGVVRTERVPRADVVDVCILDEPSSGGHVHGVAIGMRSGQISLNDARSSRRRSYEPIRDRIATFLGVPARP